MGIRVGQANTTRDWTQLAADATEIAIQLIALGPNGYSNAISALLRFVRGQRGNDTIETRATRLIFETLGYAAAATIGTSQTGRKPEKPEIQTIICAILNRARTLMNQDEIIFETEHLSDPTSFTIFKDCEERIAHELTIFDRVESEPNAKAIFRKFIAEGVSRIRTREVDYFSNVIEALSGPDATPDNRSRAWDRYRALLIKRFEEEPLFAEDPITGVTLGQVYQPLRAWWQNDDDTSVEVTAATAENAKSGGRKKRCNIAMLEETIFDWLNKSTDSDCIRLVSGGPGSGKSTFAKQLAAKLAQEPRWRVLLVPLQRLRGSGPIEERINEYFRLQLDEPFDADTVPLASLKPDGSDDWLVIFDGLDELAKEGASSESAAQDFASALADWRGRVGSTRIRFLVLGRAPSMQEARRRLGLGGRGTVHVADMVPFDKGSETVTWIDPAKLSSIDQRPEFWKKWAAAKGLDSNPPEAMLVAELADLTKEPLLAYLLILSGYASNRWPEAANNRNRIYQAIFDQIWERERSKSSRIYLNDLGREGFGLLMQSLGLAAWRGGGRTGDAATFTAVRDTFMRPDVLAKAKALGAAELNNVALLFYTSKDEEGGQGYEFLHKSFGEYLTACGLFGAFLRWGYQAADATLDFDSNQFLQKWLTLCGPAPITREILVFLRNEIRLKSLEEASAQPWKLAREWVEIAINLIDAAVRNGIPAHTDATKSWRIAELAERNAEISLIAILDACGSAGFPEDLFGQSTAEGAWTAGPIRIPIFEDDVTAFGIFVARLTVAEATGYLSLAGYPMVGGGGILLEMLSRLSLRLITFDCRSLIGANLHACNFEGASMRGSVFKGSKVPMCNFRNANLEHSVLEVYSIEDADFRGAILNYSNFSPDQMKLAITDKPFRPVPPLSVRGDGSKRRRKTKNPAVKKRA